jgi:hypothetical protein
MSGVRTLAASLAVLCLALGACRSLENAAAKDPVKCERDPNCTKRSEKSKDCATQCADNPECMKRCEMIQGGVDRGR